MSDYLPEDLIYKILTGLPAKPLMRFKCVSKRWRSLISDSQFAKTHLQLASAHQTLTHGFLVCTSPYIPQLESSVLESPSFGDRSSARKLVHPTEEEGLPVLLLGSCNGFVFTCLRLVGHPSRNYSIWNPTTGFFLNLPDPEFPYYDDYVDYYFRRFIHHGIGYVHETDEYKVVVSANDVSTLKVLSLRDQYWREITYPHKFVDQETEGVGLHETLHWVVFDYEPEPPQDPEPYMVAFELRNEDFRIMQLPLAAIGEDQSLALFSWRGCMCLWVYPIWYLRPLFITENSRTLLRYSDGNSFVKLELVKVVDEEENQEEEVVSYRHGWHERSCGWASLMIVYDETVFSSVMVEPKQLETERAGQETENAAQSSNELNS
ncbi:hypothetical protein ACLB2K_003923 [Fragaria x ananassa]